MGRDSDNGAVGEVQSLDRETRSLVSLLDLLSEWTEGNISSRAGVAEAIRAAVEEYSRISGYRPGHDGPLFRGTAIPGSAYRALKEGRPAVLAPRAAVQSWTSSEVQAGYFAAESNEDHPAVVLSVPADRLTVLAGLDELFRRLPPELQGRYSSFMSGDGPHDENEFIVVGEVISLGEDSVIRILDAPWDDGYDGDEPGPCAPSP